MDRNELMVWACVALLSIGQLRAQDIKSFDNGADTIPVVIEKVNLKRFILPASLIAVGVAGTVIDGMNDYHLFVRSERDNPLRVDDYLEWGLLGTVFVNDLIGKEKHNWVDQLFLLAIAGSMNGLMVQTVKVRMNERRPNYSDYSFPSGHTSNAFLGAHLNYHEFKDTSPVLAYSGYPLAAFVAFARIYGKRHWVADVVGGAAFGILSVELAYLIYFPIRNAIAKQINLNRESSLVITPSFNSHGAGIYLSYRF